MADPVDAPEFPKPMVRVRRAAHGGLEADIREVADGEAEEAATTEGFVTVDVPASPFPEYPKWVYHADGRRQVVQTEAELEALGDGFEDAPPSGEKEEPAPEDVGEGAPR